MLGIACHLFFVTFFSFFSTGCTGVHQAVTLWEQLTGKAGDAQIEIPKDRPYGLSVNMGGDDKTLVSIVYRRGE